MRTTVIAAALVAMTTAAQTAAEIVVVRCGRGRTEVRFELDLRSHVAMALYPDGTRRGGTVTRSETRYLIDLPNPDGATVARWVIDRANGWGAVAPRVSPSSGAFRDAPIPVSCSSDPPRPP
jgi:hypothetical protein